jgi:hypothetical protein
MALIAQVASRHADPKQKDGIGRMREMAGSAGNNIIRFEVQLVLGLKNKVGRRFYADGMRKIFMLFLMAGRAQFFHALR